ncbi:signal transduction histidine kinase [Clostridium sp. SY8519]|uniref:sensor histidine kinase n=1 Tax=Clostridium sp. (strain SY8519) TaxID=1042156 RepID=UPI0002171BB8|nr:HAMP domain-containing sensor histidine kinase [Clostridium sp. SY8519]BAK46471.1 signal transduction histidine kinase [Clostridium sp. SY8519]
MNERTIRKLRKKFIKMFIVAAILVMAFIGTLINTTNVVTSRQLIYSTLSYIADNNGTLKKDADAYQAENSDSGSTGNSSSQESDEEKNETRVENRLNSFSSEFHYSARYFAVIFDKNGTVQKVKTSHIASVTGETAEKYAKKVLRRKFSYGRHRVYFYLRQVNEEGNTIVVFLDCTSQLQSEARLIFLTILICGAGLLLTYLLLLRLSDLIIRPELENMKRQKQFLTNASHELKTPLAVIRANTEVEEMMNGENEWTRSTRRQIDRMDGLIQNLVMISRAEEQEVGEVTDVNMTELVRETVEPFSALAKQDQKELVLQLDDAVMFRADASQVRQLTSLLIDNAIKYCDDGGKVQVTLLNRNNMRIGWKKDKNIRLIISNSYAEGENVDFSRFFDRFYREDQSHNTEKGGYGIGLSVAESIVHQYKGTIEAEWKEGMISFVCRF